MCSAVAAPVPRSLSAATVEPDGHAPLISVIIPVYNGARALGDCLRALLTSDFPSFETIVVDDGSTDDSVPIARVFPVRVIETAANRGAGAARNRGAEVARGRYLFFLDADVLVTPDTLRAVADSFEQRPDISALFCSYQKGTIPANFWSRYKNLVHHHTHQTAREDAATFCGGFGAIRRDVFVRCGGFDESYRALEDIELGYRLHSAGHRIWLNKSIQLTHCKHYTFMGLLKSDLLSRAVPWTRLMLRKRIARNDLNTRLHNVLSVPMAFGLMAAALGALVSSACAWLALALLVAFLVLNRGFFACAWREGGAAFTLGVIGMTWVTYLYSGIGMGLGLLAFMVERAPVSRRLDTLPTQTPGG